MASAPARARWLLPLLAALLIAAGDPSGSPTRRIAVIGASVSDGFGVRIRAAEPGADGVRVVTGVNLATLLGAAAKDPAAIGAVSLSTSSFFANPDKAAKDSVRQAIEAKPSMVLAIDWLFWSSYGSRRADGKPIRGCDDRTERLDRALEALQPLVETGVPIVLGDLPDMHCAVEGGMLTEPMVPEVACLDRLNERIRAWSAERPNVALLDLREVVRRSLSKQPIRACNRDWCETDLGPLMQKDRLHPTLNGMLAVVASALQAADTKTGGACSTAFELDPQVVRNRLARLARNASPAAAPPDATTRTGESPPTGSSAAPPRPPAAGDSSSPSAP